MNKAHHSPTHTKAVVDNHDSTNKEIMNTNIMSVGGPPPPRRNRGRCGGGGGGGIGIGIRRVNFDEERLKKNRRIIDNYLRRVTIGTTTTNTTLMKKELSLNSDGVVYFPYHKFIIVLEVPEDNPSMLYLYTMVFRLVPQQDNQLDILRLAMQLNYMQLQTRGSTLGLEDDEVNLCSSYPIAGLTVHDLQTLLNEFLVAAVTTNEWLEETRRRTTTSTIPTNSNSTTKMVSFGSTTTMTR